jgi:hypothetical protein
MAFYDSDDSYFDGDFSDDDEYGNYLGDGAAQSAGAGGGGGGESAKDSVLCECKKCRETVLGKHHPMHPNEFYERRSKIETQQLAEYTARNGHLAKNDPLRHPCGNGAVQSRRHCILTHKGFCVHAPNPSVPMAYMETDGGIPYAFGRPTRPGEVRNDDRFCNSFKTPEGMTVRHYTRLIDDFHRYHESIDSLFAAFPRHHALAMASLSSTCAIIEKGLWATEKTGLRLGDSALNATTFVLSGSNAYFKRGFGIAKKYAQDPFEITRFTEMSVLQKNTVLAHSGIAGLVISRLFTPPCLPKTQYGMSHMVCVKQSRVVANRIHSAEEPEIFADNRYGKSGKYDGNPSHMYSGSISSMIPDYDALTPETARGELRVLYASEIHKIMGGIQRLKRGLINVDEIRGNTAFRRIYALWFFCMKDLVAKQDDHDSRVMLIVDVLGLCAEFPLMYSTEMLSLYSKSSARFVKVSLGTILRLTSNASSANRTWSVGCRAGILAFAAVEPRMVDQYLAPKLAICTFDGNDKPEALENHVPSRCPIFGELRKKFQVHMPRTGDCEWELCRKNGGSIRSFYPPS